MLGVVATVALLGTLVTVHEFGHFLVAKLFGVAVPVFSVGWGPRAFGFRYKETDYRVSWLPLGGYMRSAGADEFGEGGGYFDDDPALPDHKKFKFKPAWQRAAIKAGGPAMNFVLPVFVFAVLYLIGEPQPGPVILTVRDGTPADEAGLRPLDRVTSVNGTEVTTWIDVEELVAGSDTPELTLGIERDGEPATLTMTTTGDAPWYTSDYGFLDYAPASIVVVDDPASPAARAGLLTGDQLTEIDGHPLTSWPELLAAIGPAPRRFEAKVARADGTTTDVTVTPDPTWAPEVVEADDALWRWSGLASAGTGISGFPDGASVARDAGLQVGDRILSIDGRTTRTYVEVVAGVQASADKLGADGTTHPIPIVARRAGKLLTFDVTPVMTHDSDDFGRYRWRALIGAAFNAPSVEPPNVIHAYSPFQSLRRAGLQVVNVASTIVHILGMLATLQIDPNKTVGGPIEMARQSYQAWQLGAFAWAQRLGQFSISLAVVNLLPVPVFDGGDLLIYLAEAVRGRPLPRLLRERAQQFGIIFIAVLLFSVIVLDVHRVLS